LFYSGKKRLTHRFPQPALVFVANTPSRGFDKKLLDGAFFCNRQFSELAVYAAAGSSYVSRIGLAASPDRRGDSYQSGNSPRRSGLSASRLAAVYLQKSSVR